MLQAKKICFSLQPSHVWEDRLGKYNQLTENIRLYDFNKEGRLVQQSNIV